MSSMTNQEKDQEVLKITGALDALGTLREALSQWVGEAQNDLERAALDNVLAHVIAMEIEYERRKGELDGASKA